MSVEKPIRLTQFSPARQGATAPVRFLRRLIIVSREDLKLYKSLRRTFADAERTQVTLDRRFRERRELVRTHSIERRRTDRRSRPVHTDISVSPVVDCALVRFPQPVAPRTARASLRASLTSGGAGGEVVQQGLSRPYNTAEFRRPKSVSSLPRNHQYATPCRNFQPVASPSDPSETHAKRGSRCLRPAEDFWHSSHLRRRGEVGAFIALIQRQPWPASRRRRRRSSGSRSETSCTRAAAGCLP